MAIQTINNGELLNVIRTKINQNFSEVEITGNKVQTISSTPSALKYPSEKAVSDYASKIHFSSTVPTSKSGDLLLHTNAPVQSGGVKGKLKMNSGGTLTEFVPDRSVCARQPASLLASMVPLSGEIVFETDTNGMKVGDGSSSYASLPYVGGGGSGGGTSTAGIESGGSETNGWIKYPNGLIMQWGYGVFKSDSSQNFNRMVILPVSFTSQMIYSHGVLETGVSWDLAQILVHSRADGKGSIRFVVDSSGIEAGNKLAADSFYGFRWIAIGF